MSEVENKPVDVPAAEPAPAEDTAGVDLVSTHSASATPAWEGPLHTVKLSRGVLMTIGTEDR